MKTENEGKLHTYAFFYFMKNQSEAIGETVPGHIAYWKDDNYRKIQGGPFADRSGGMVVFQAESLDSATLIANSDPFVKEDLLDNSWVKEWILPDHS